jgi:hypothetical protein
VGPGQVAEAREVEPGQVAEAREVEPDQVAEAREVEPGQVAEAREVEPDQVAEAREVDCHSSGAPYLDVIAESDHAGCASRLLVFVDSPLGVVTCDQPLKLSDDIWCVPKSVEGQVID